ncbi:putative coat protein [Zostera marina amalgavirus 1]|uniref:Putative coat protein n=1 Tax=Zostera marina amalgavirus 1 TaxID=1985202 RepID=A0A1W6R5F0_9VIRU|nr:putative coat protein [Zostera marina amalgavirus 1]ARO49646.1 putative coat protein [Zostera marina amalgavirus 1]
MAEDLRSQQTLDDRDNLKLLTDAFKAYPEGGLSVVDVSLEGIAACNYTVSRAVKVMKILKPLTKNEHLIKLFHYANDVSNISSILPMTLETNFKFCKWLTSPVAKKKIAALQNADRLRRRGSDVVTPEEAAMIALLESAQADRTTEYSKARARYDIDVAKYKKKIAKRTRQLEEDLDKVQASYPGLQLIERPDEHSVMASAWHRYVDFCTSNNFEVPQKNDGNLARAYKQFERELTLEIKNTACQKPEVRDYLLQYCKEKVKGFRAQFEDKRAQTYRGYYACATGDILPEDTPRKKRKASRPDTGGEANQEGEDDSEHSVIPNLLDTCVGDDRRAWDKTHPTNPEKPGNDSSSDESAENQPASTVADRTRTRRRKADKHSKK